MNQMHRRNMHITHLQNNVLEEISRIDGRPVSEHIRAAIETYIKSWIDQHGGEDVGQVDLAKFLEEFRQWREGRRDEGKQS